MAGDVVGVELVGRVTNDAGTVKLDRDRAGGLVLGRAEPLEPEPLAAGAARALADEAIAVEGGSERLRAVVIRLYKAKHRMGKRAR
jgi:hypothetical protein